MNAFKEYVTGTAFALSLSKPQIECLCQIEQTGGSWSLLTTSYALQRKGLVMREFDGANNKMCIKLTDAGKALMPLLKLAGLWMDFSVPDAVVLPPVCVREKVSA
jgi:hypothetical protein